MVRFKLRGSFKKTNAFFKNNKQLTPKIQRIIKKYADEGLRALKTMTPKDTGLTAEKWTYTIRASGVFYENSSMQDGQHVVILLQYGHATRNGGYVQAIDFINPALRPIFDKISLGVWKEVTES